MSSSTALDANKKLTVTLIQSVPSTGSLSLGFSFLGFFAAASSSAFFASAAAAAAKAAGSGRTSLPVLGSMRLP